MPGQTPPGGAHLHHLCQMASVTVKLYNADRVVKEYSTQVDAAIMG